MPERRERHLAALDVKPGAAMESQSGLQLLRPRIYGAYEVPSPAAGDVERRIGERVAELVPDGATLQMGIGAIPSAVALRLVARRARA